MAEMTFFASSTFLAALAASACVACALALRHRGPATRPRLPWVVWTYVVLAPWPLIGLFGLRVGTSQPWMSLTWAGIGLVAWGIGRWIRRSYPGPSGAFTAARRVALAPAVLYVITVVPYALITIAFNH